MAHDAAADGDYATALGWLATIEAVDGTLPTGLDQRRREWAGRMNAASVIREHSSMSDLV